MTKNHVGIRTASVICSALSQRPDLLAAINMELRRHVNHKDNVDGGAWTSQEKEMNSRSEVLTWLRISAEEATTELLNHVQN